MKNKPLLVNLREKGRDDDTKFIIVAPMGASCITFNMNLASFSMSNIMHKTSTHNTNVVDALAASAHSRKWVELKVAELSQGIVSALASSTMTPSQAWSELLNLDTYQAIRRLRLHADLRELFEWGMELTSVEKHVPSALPESYEKMSTLANRVIRRGIAAPRRRQAV